MKLAWTRNPAGDWIATKGNDVYRIRHVTLSMTPMWWVYHGVITKNGYRYVARHPGFFKTLTEAKRFVGDL